MKGYARFVFDERVRHRVNRAVATGGDEESTAAAERVLDRRSPRSTAVEVDDGRSELGVDDVTHPLVAARRFATTRR